MRLDIVNHATPTGPVAEMYDLIGVQLWHVAAYWPEARSIIRDLGAQQFYLELVDNLPETPDALGYHSVDDTGRPFSRVAVGPSFAAGSDWLTGPYSVVSVLGHEAIETVLDPLCNRWIARGGDSDLVAQEGCDAVQGCNYEHRGASLTDFLLPAWFNAFGQPPFDFTGTLDRPFQLGAGGYTLVDAGGRVDQEFAAEAPPEWRQHGTRAALRAGSI